MQNAPAPRYSNTDPTFQIAYRSTTDGGAGVHLLTVRARNIDDARNGFEMRCAPGATLLAVRAA